MRFELDIRHERLTGRDAKSIGGSGKSKGENSAIAELKVLIAGQESAGPLAEKRSMWPAPKRDSDNLTRTPGPLTDQHGDWYGVYCVVRFRFEIVRQ